MSDQKETNELDVLVPTGRTIRLVDGSVKSLPPVTWGREIRVLRVLSSLIKNLSKTGVLGGEVAFTEQEMAAKVMEVLFDLAPEQITEAASALTGEKTQWVEENLDIEGIITLLVPFLQNKQTSIAKTMAPYLPRTEEVSPLN